MTFQGYKQWRKWISLAEFRYNSNFDSEIEMTPHQALYGIPQTVASFAELLQEKTQMVALLKENL